MSDTRIPPLRSFEVDLEARLATIVLADGVEFNVPLTADLFPNRAGVRRASFDIVRDRVELILPAGDEVVWDAPDAQGLGPSVRPPVVYLDQLHWIALAQHRWAPDRLSKSENEHAECFLEIIERREATVVMSAANVSEMTQTDGRHRRHVATMILTLSHGWQMRSPLAIRAHELRAAMEGDDPRVADPFTLRAGAIFADQILMPEAPSEFPADWRHWFQVVTAANATVAAMIENEKILKTEGEAMAQSWAKSHHELALYMRANTPKGKKRITGHARFVADMGHEIAAAAQGAGLDQDRLDHWLHERMASDLTRMPYLGRHYQVVIDRLTNADDRWEGNDLADINFLACAAGYADLLIGEKKVIEYLKRATGSVTEGAFVCRRLSDAVEFLQDRAGK